MKRLLASLILLISLAACQPAAPGEEGDFTPAPTFTLAATNTPTSTPAPSTTLEPTPNICGDAAAMRAEQSIRALMQQPELRLEVNSSSSSLYNHQLQVIAFRDQPDFREYKVLCASGEVVEVGTARNWSDIPNELTAEELEQSARDFVTRAAPNLDLSQLKFAYSSIDAAHIYRWDGTQKLTDPPGGMTVFVQVALQKSGDLLTYINLIAMLPAE